MLDLRDHRLIADLTALCHQASAVILSYYGNQARLKIQNKANDTPLTQADIAAHDILSAGLPQIIDIPVISEESSITLQLQRHHDYWLIDPIDGTREFINQTDEFCIAIARIVNHRPVFGFIYSPITREFWCALTGKGAYKGQDQTQQPSSNTSTLNRLFCRELGKPITVITGGRKLGKQMRAYIESNFGAFIHLTSGSALKFCQIAEAKADIYPKLSSKTSEWDIAAGDIILNEAGGGLRLDNGEQPQYGVNNTTLNPPFLAFGAGLSSQSQVKYAKSISHFQTQPN